MTTTNSKTTDYLSCAACTSRVMSAFSSLGAAGLENLMQGKRCLYIKKGEKIFHEGSLPRGLYCVHKGKLKITKAGPRGLEQILHLAREGDILGYRAILGKDRYSCSATALEDATVCLIPIDVFNRVIDENPQVAARIMSLFTTLLKDAEKKATSIMQRTARERVAQGLLTIKEYYGCQPDGQTLSLTLSRQELADFCSTTRETTTRELFGLEKEEVIVLAGKKITLLKPEQLITIANLQW